MHDKGNNDNGQLEDFWWTVLVTRLFHPVQVQIIEALRISDEPLTPGQLSGIFEEEVQWTELVYHLRCLSDRDIVVPAERPRSLSKAMYMPYRLRLEVTAL